MIAIATLTQWFLYNGVSLPLPGAAFMENVVSISKVSATGRGYVTYTSEDELPAFNTLEPGNVYGVVSRQVPYEIPEETPIDVPTLEIALTTDVDILPLIW